MYSVHGLNLLKTRPWLNQERKVNVHKRTVLLLVTDKPKSRDRFFYSERRLNIKTFYTS